MLLGYLILAHLLGDFVFQPNELVIWKNRSRWGILVHASVHFLLTILLLSPFILNGSFWLIGVAFAIAFVHFWIDQTKISYDVNHDEKVLPFLLDQLMHLLIMILAYFFTVNIPLSLPEDVFYSAYSDIRLIAFFSLLILFSTVVEIYRFQLIREKKRNATFKINSKNTLKRTLAFTLLYAIFMLLSFYARGNYGL